MSTVTRSELAEGSVPIARKGPLESNGRQRYDRIVTVGLLCLGLIATTLVVVQALFWSWSFGTTVEWGRPLTLIPQLVIFAVGSAICVWRLVRGHLSWWIAAVSVVAAAIFFWIAEGAAIASLPCPSFC